MPHRRAVIDVGTNSVKLLVAEVVRQTVTPLHENSRQTRLGEGFYASRVLQPEPIARTAEAVKSFAQDAAGWGASSVRAFATSAAREAANQADLVAAVRRAAGLELEIISGEQEAEWGFRGVISNPSFAGRRLLLVDLGGGSAQFIVGDHGHARFSRSYPIGCVRLLEKLRPADHPTPMEWQKAQQAIQEFLAAHVVPEIQPWIVHERPAPLLVGTGGTATILARMEAGMEGFDRDRIESVRLSRPLVTQWREKLWGMPLASRKNLPGLPANRADVILFGSAIYALVMEALGLDELRISTRGLRFGALMD